MLRPDRLESPFSGSAHSAILASVLVFAAVPALAQARPQLEVLPAEPEPGAVVRLALQPAAGGNDQIASVTGILAGEVLNFVQVSGGDWHAIGGIPTDAAGKVVARAFVVHRSGRRDTVRAAMTLPPLPVVKAEHLAVDSSFSTPMSSATSARIAHENELAHAIGRRSHNAPPRWSEPFVLPRDSHITSAFGSGRVFNGIVTSRHLGIDFRGAIGEPIRAANRGVVALVDTFYLAGRVVYIDHGGGITTAYFHMSTPLVARGDTVERGQIIGRVGNTGRVTGPHLHWTARYGAITVNPSDLLTLDSWLDPGPGHD
jgi:murein DD-endopeptidase MepM/ murein hydrolase activator NlpD